jgi:hypothetical protein
MGIDPWYLGEDGVFRTLREKTEPVAKQRACSAPQGICSRAAAYSKEHRGRQVLEITGFQLARPSAIQ